MPEKEENKQKELQQKYMELQMISQQMQQYTKQVEMLENQILDLDSTNEALSDLKKTKEGTKILSPIASGIFVQSKLEDNQEVLVNVGSNTTVKKTIDGAKELILEQKKEIVRFRTELESNIAKFTSDAKKIENELFNLTK